MKTKFKINDIVKNIHVNDGSVFIIKEIKITSDGILYTIDNGSIVMEAEEYIIKSIN